MSERTPKNNALNLPFSPKKADNLPESDRKAGAGSFDYLQLEISLSGYLQRLDLTFGNYATASFGVRTWNALQEDPTNVFEVDFWCTDLAFVQTSSDYGD